MSIREILFSAIGQMSGTGAGVGDSKNYQELFRQYVVELFGRLKSVPGLDAKTCVKARQHFINDDRQAYVEQTVRNLFEHIAMISGHDLNMFSPEYGKALVFVPGLDFRRLWPTLRGAGGAVSSGDRRWPAQQADPVMTDLFGILKMIFIYGALHLKQHKTLVREMIETIKMRSNMEEEIAKAEERERDDAKRNAFDFKAIMGDSPIATIITEIMHDPEVTGLLEEQIGRLASDNMPNPMELLKTLTSGDTVAVLTERFRQRFFEKLASHGYRPEDLENEVRRLYDRMTNSLNRHPMLKHFRPLMKQMEQRVMGQVADGAATPEQMQQQFHQHAADIMGLLQTPEMQAIAQQMGMVKAGPEQGPVDDDKK